MSGYCHDETFRFGSVKADSKSANLVITLPSKVTYLVCRYSNSIFPSQNWVNHGAYSNTCHRGYCCHNARDTSARMNSGWRITNEPTKEDNMRVRTSLGRSSSSDNRFPGTLLASCWSWVGGTIGFRHV
jgi:hypothetical protein